ncbi:MAG: hypothetical protein R2734_06785 [Nocardioides sp.]
MTDWIQAVATALAAFVSVAAFISAELARRKAGSAIKIAQTVTTSVKTARRAALAATLQHLSDLYHVQASAKEQGDGSWLVTVDSVVRAPARRVPNGFAATLPDETIHFTTP